MQELANKAVWAVVGITGILGAIMSFMESFIKNYLPKIYANLPFLDTKVVYYISFIVALIISLLKLHMLYMEWSDRYYLWKEERKNRDNEDKGKRPRSGRQSK